MFDIAGYFRVMLEGFGHPTQQNHVHANAMVKARHILKSFSLVEGSYGCDLLKVKTKVK